jgi:hypothetical protein
MENRKRNKIMRVILLFLLVSGALRSQEEEPDYSISGVFYIDQVKWYDTTFTTLNTNNGVSAFFNFTPCISILPGEIDSAGVITFNGDSLLFDAEKKFYSKIGIDSVSTKHWQVSGNGEIPQMNFLYNGQIPVFNVCAGLVKDTLSKDDSLIVLLNDIQNADSVLVTIWDDNQLVAQHRVLCQIPNFGSYYYIIPEVMETLEVGPRAAVKIEAINYSYQTVADKQFLFRNSYSYLRRGIYIRNNE